MNNFADVVEEVKSLTMDEKEDLQFFLEKHLSELRRDEILTNHEKSMQEFKNNDIRFSPDFTTLKSRLKAL
jgi:hypothetical protein